MLGHTNTPVPRWSTLGSKQPYYSIPSSVKRSHDVQLPSIYCITWRFCFVCLFVWSKTLPVCVGYSTTASPLFPGSVHLAHSDCSASCFLLLFPLIQGIDTDKNTCRINPLIPTITLTHWLNHWFLTYTSVCCRTTWPQVVGIFFFLLMLQQSPRI